MSVLPRRIGAAAPASAASARGIPVGLRDEARAVAIAAVVVHERVAVEERQRALDAGVDLARLLGVAVADLRDGLEVLHHRSDPGPLLVLVLRELLLADEVGA